MKQVPTIYTQGFWAYPFSRNGGTSTARAFGALRCPGHKVHVVVIADRAQAGDQDAWTVVKLPNDIDDVPDAAATTEPSRIVARFRQGTSDLPPAPADVKMRGFSKSGEPTGGDFESMAMIPDARFVVSPRRLERGWDEAVKLVVPCVGGDITSVPDDDTFNRVWRLAPRRAQRVSNVVRYQVPGSADRIMLGSFEMALKPESVVVMFNVANRASLPKSIYERGLDHSVALAKLCRPAEKLLISSPGQSKAKVLDKRPDEYRDILVHARTKVGLQNQAGTADDGYPSCRGKMIEVKA